MFSPSLTRPSFRPPRPTRRPTLRRWSGGPRVSDEGDWRVEREMCDEGGLAQRTGSGGAIALEVPRGPRSLFTRSRAGCT
eukprot:6834762-Pyramimonas_sp.AAC.1